MKNKGKIFFSALILIWACVVLASFVIRSLPFEFSVLKPLFSADTYGNVLSPENGLAWRFNAARCLVFAWMVLVAFIAGRAVMGLLKVACHDALEDAVFSVGMGCGIISYVTLALGLLGLLKPAVFWLLLALPTGFFICHALKNGISFRINFSLAGLPFAEKVFFILLCVSIFASFFGVFSPEVFYDSLFYHLGVPNHYLREGKILPVPANLYSNFPFTVEMLYLAGMVLSDEVVAKLFNFLFGIQAVLIIFCFTRRYWSERAAMIAACLFYVSPLVVLCSWMTVAEPGLTVFLMLALYSLINWSADAGEKKWLVLSGIFSGLAMGVKYTGMIFFAGLVMTVLLIAFRGGRDYKRALGAFFLFCVIAVLVFSPWLMKNACYKGNPVYPYAAKVFGKSDMEPEKFASFVADTKGGFEFTAKNMALEFWNMTMPHKNREGHLSPPFLIFLPLVLLLGAVSFPLKCLIVYFCACFIMLGSGTQFVRFFVPLLPVFSIVMGVSLSSGLLKGRGMMRFILLMVFLFNLYYVAVLVSRWQVYAVPLGLQTRESFLSSAKHLYPNPSFGVIDYINTSLPAKAKVLFIGETRGYYCRRRHITNSVFDVPLMVRWVRQVNSGKELCSLMRGQGVTHILFNSAEMKRTEPYNPYRMDRREFAVFMSFWNSCLREAASYGNSFLYEIKGGT